jgi:DNA-directed RNA polymerase specialized sigma24 family protein
MGRDRLNIDELFKFYYRPLCLYATHYVQDVEMAKDIVQDCFSSLWEKMNNEKSCEVSNMKAYLYVMVKNRSLDEEVEERSVMEARMWTAIDALPERCREVFLLHKRDGLKYQEIAEKFHISVHTVDSHIQKAFRLIREGAYKVYMFLFN